MVQAQTLPKGVLVLIGGAAISKIHVQRDKGAVDCLGGKPPVQPKVSVACTKIPKLITWIAINPVYSATVI